MKGAKATISVFYTIWGHKSIGNAIEDALGNKYNICSNFVELNSVSVKPYNMLYVLFPHLSGIPFKISERENISKITEKYLSKVYAKKIERLIKKQKPKIVISAYFAFNFTLIKLAKRYGFILINVLADPRSFHRLTAQPEAYNFVFDKKAYNRCLLFGLADSQIVQSGWFVRKQFQPPYDTERVRKSLGLSLEKFTISVIGGSQGTISILKILPAFTDMKQDVQVIFVCGKNKSLYKSLKLFQKVHNLSQESNVTFIIKGFTTNTHKYMQASDIVIGKAGPNLLFETVASQTPFFAVSHISGQEDGNLEIIRSYKIGFVEEKTRKAINLTKRIVKHPEVLKRFQNPLQNLAEYNNKSYKILDDFIEKKLTSIKTNYS
jgi:UDP-N-acetylglucosamine:LPS N-acetylglucosamine transferase